MRDGEKRKWSNTFTDVTVKPFSRPTGPTVSLSADPRYVSHLFHSRPDQPHCHRDEQVCHCLPCSISQGKWSSTTVGDKCRGNQGILWFVHANEHESPPRPI